MRSVPLAGRPRGPARPYPGAMHRFGDPARAACARLVATAQSMRASTLACLACAGYLLGTALPLEHDIPLLLLALVGGAAVYLDAPGGRYTVRSGLRWRVLALLATAATATIVSDDVARSARLSIPLLLPPAFLFFLIADQFRSVREIRLVCWTLSLVAAGIALAVLRTYVTTVPGDPSTLIARIDIPLLIVPNDVALLGLIAPLSLALGIGSSNGRTRILAAGSLLLSAAVIVLLQSRGAALAMTVGLVSTVLCIRPRLAVLTGLAALAFVIGVDAARGFPLAAKFHHVADPRLALWVAAIAMFRAAPLLGHGAHTFSVHYRTYLADLDLPTWMVVEDRLVPWPHNLYLEVLAERGLVGFAALGAVIICALVLGRRLHTSRSREVRVLGAGLLGALIALCTVGLVELTLLRQWVWLMLLVLIGSIAWLSNAERHDTEGFR